MLISNNIYHINQDGTKTKIDIGQSLIYKNLVQVEAVENTFTIDLQEMCSNYSITPTTASTIAITAANITIPDNMLLEFNLFLDMTSGVQTITFPDTLTWVNGVAPTLSTAKLYKINIISTDKGTSFKGWLMQ